MLGNNIMPWPCPLFSILFGRSGRFTTAFIFTFMQVQVEPARLLREFYETEIEISIYFSRPQRECLVGSFECWAGGTHSEKTSWHFFSTFQLRNANTWHNKNKMYYKQLLGVLRSSAHTCDLSAQLKTEKPKPNCWHIPKMGRTLRPDKQKSRVRRH